jgi:nucleoside-diphosphate-sugar epimerase
VRDPDRARQVLEPRGVEIGDDDLVRGDMTDPVSVERVLGGCEGVVHAAAVVATTGRDNRTVVATNVTGTRTVVGAAERAGVRSIVYLSTVGVFVPPVQPRIDAASPITTGGTAYSRSKVEAERWVRSRQQEGAPIVTVYPGGVLGPDQPGVAEVVEGLRGCLEKAWPITGGGVNLIDVRDLAALVVAGLERGRGPDRWMAGGTFLTWREFADRCDRITQRRARRFALPPAGIRARGRVVDLVRRIVPFDYPLTSDAAQFMTTMVPTDDEHTHAASGVRFRDVEETLADTIRWMVRAGELRARAAGVLGSMQEPGTV